MASITVDCPPFEYENVPGWTDLLAARTKAALILLRSKSPAEKLDLCKDGRAVHAQYFRNLTPGRCHYYAGNYRGSDLPCLRDYKVQIPADPLVGHPPDRVTTDMTVLGHDIGDVVASGDFVWQINNAVLAPAEKLYRVIQLGVALFVYFLQIHPYANGNGHLARFFLITFLARYNIFLARWPMHPRPADPPYSALIGSYRRGNRADLEKFVLSCI